MNTDGIDFHGLEASVARDFRKKRRVIGKTCFSKLVEDGRDPSLALGILKPKAANQKSSEAEHAPSCAATSARESDVEM